MSRWFRWYEGTCEDGKFRVVARNADVTVAVVMGVWAMLLEDASHPDHRGVAERGEPFYCAILDIEEARMISILSAMESVNLISVGHGSITITKWKERQFETDATDPTNADRQRRWRNNHRNEQPKHKRNGKVTATKRPDTESDTDTEKEERGAPRSRSTRLSADWTPSEKNKEDAKALGLTDADIARQTQRFRDWWIAAPDAKARKANWDATWRNWCDKEAERLGRPLPDQSASAPSGQVYIKQTDERFDAWNQYRKAKEGKTFPVDKNGGWNFPSEWPPGHPKSTDVETEAA